MGKMGRPKGKSVYLEGELNRLIVNVIRSTGGLTATRDEILITGIKINPGKPPSRFPISLPTPKCRTMTMNISLIQNGEISKYLLTPEQTPARLALSMSLFIFHLKKSNIYMLIF